MYKSYYEKNNRNSYDSVRKYCGIEKVDEAYLRTSMRKTGLGGKSTLKDLVIMVLIFGCIGLSTLFYQGESCGMKKIENNANESLISADDMKDSWIVSD
ncbi:MAG TPA: hypothetical protein DDZ89_16970 [Clostridiales bacterium]|nr:hypothetical protein [Clostridiales bacterium]